MFKNRSYAAELLDNEHLPKEDLYQNLRELDFINRYLGGHDVVLKAIKKMLIGISKTQQIHILEIGSGGGDNLRAIATWGKKHGYDFKLTGVDLKQDCTDFAVQQSKSYSIKFITCDYQKAPFEQIGKPDIVFNSLFCHHFTDEQLHSMLNWMNENTSIGYTICDLHRHRLAYYSIKFLTAVFSKSYLVKNDAPLSVLRGFSKNEIVKILNEAKQGNFKINWAWAFRWIITVQH
ncbi:MAG: methyltransferase domain-containing protein [Spirosomaceae bacterium]|nr:methyltransferase domain-containing protein [Spirosomataceae bacterium]